MPITIWQTPQHVDGFTYQNVSGSAPIATSSELEPAPYSGMTKTAEVARFSGYKKSCYADTGDMELTIPAGQIEPEDIAIGYWVDIEGDNYQIERIEWKRVEGGYECVIAGSDFGTYLDRYIQTVNNIVGSKIYPSTSNKMQLSKLKNNYLPAFFADRMDVNNRTDNPLKAGWWRLSKTISTKYEVAPPTEAGNTTVMDVLSWGAQLRVWCSWFGIGYRAAVIPNYNYSPPIPSVNFQLYNRADQGVILNASGRGVYNFKFSRDIRNTVNAVTATAVGSYNLNGVHSGTKTLNITTTRYLPRTGLDTNHDILAENLRMTYVDLGEVPDEYDISTASVGEWISEQVLDKYSASPYEEIVTFEYDNTGVYKYGEHFFLGSPVTLIDEYLGIEVHTKLTNVKTAYSAGTAKAYSFEFGDKQITQNDKLKSKFNSIDRRTYKTRVEA